MPLISDKCLSFLIITLTPLLRVLTITNFYDNEFLIFELNITHKRPAHYFIPSQKINSCVLSAYLSSFQDCYVFIQNSENADGNILKLSDIDFNFIR